MNHHDNDDPFLTAGQVAKVLGGVSPKTITRWATQGKLSHIRTLGGHRRFRESDVRQLARKLSREAEQ